MRLRPQDPMRAKATDSGVEDGWRGARIGAEVRDRARREATRIAAAVDIGEPPVPRVVGAFLALTIVATVLEFAAFGTSPSTSELSRAGGAGIGVVATGAWWKLLASNLLHANLVHVAMNAFVIYLTGRWLEHLVGRWIVAATILWSMLLAGIGAIVVDAPSVSIGASGVAFGLVGCALAADPRARTALGVVARQLAVVNIIGTFAIPGISIGGHLGGLVAGLLVGLACWDRTSDDESRPAGRARRGVSVALVAASVPIVALLAIGPRPDDALSGPRSRLTASLLERQLAGSTLSSGLDIDRASCEPGSSLLDYECEVDGQRAVVRFRERDDQWRLGLVP
jgi:membrane associated rhomboid family serine protease